MSAYEPLTISIASSFNCISSFEKELKAIDKAILQTVQGLNPDEYTVLNSIPGIGKVYSAGILAEMGSIKAFPNTNALAKYCGIVWNDNDSGDFVAEDKHISKAGNRYLSIALKQLNTTLFSIFIVHSIIHSIKSLTAPSPPLYKDT